jgi:hypothetical protein
MRTEWKNQQAVMVKHLLQLIEKIRQPSSLLLISIAPAGLSGAFRRVEASASPNFEELNLRNLGTNVYKGKLSNDSA